MTSRRKNKKSRNARSRDDDDLTIIRGIGPANAKLLRKVLGIHTFEDLAAAAAEEIESRLKAHKATSRTVIEEWILQARDHVTTKRPPHRIKESESSPLAENAWEQIATFVVNFELEEVEGAAPTLRTSASHMQADENAVWDGIEARELCEWMKHRAREEIDRRREKESSSSKTGLERPVLTVNVDEIRVFQPQEVDKPRAVVRPGRALDCSLEQDKPFSLEASLHITGPGFDMAVKQGVRYMAQFYARNLDTSAKLRLGNADAFALVENEASYAVRLNDAILTSGVYRASIVVAPQGHVAVGSHLAEVPVLQVV